MGTRARKVRAAAAVLTIGGLLAGCGGAGGPSGGGGAVSDDKIALGVITDLSGVYSELAGENAVQAVEMAVEDFQDKYGDEAVTTNIEVQSADHQNQPEIANTQAREFYDRDGVDAIFDVPTSSAALAVANVAKEQQKLFFGIGPATTELSNDQCNKYTFDYGYDTYMLAHGTGRTVTSQGGENWYIIYPDYAFGQDMDRSFTEQIEAAGGTVVASDATPFPHDNFSTFLLKAPSLEPKPDVLGVMQAGGDLVNVAKQYNEYQLRDEDIDLAIGLMFETDIASIGVENLSGTVFTTAWFWNLDDESRAWADRFTDRTGERPTFDHAGNYSAALQYLEAVQRAGTDDADEIVAELEGHQFEDFFARNATIQADNHVLAHDAYLVEVKDESEMSEPADFSELVETIPADEAFQPLAENTCEMG